MAKKSKKTEKDFEQDALMKEVSDDLKQDRLLELWKKYGKYVVVAIVVIIGLTAIIEGYKSWKKSVEVRETQSFVSAMSLIDAGNMDGAIAAFTDISENARTDFKDLAKLQIVNIYFEQNKLEEAIKTLEEIYNNKSINKTLRNIAGVKLVSHTLDTSDPAKLKEILQPMTIEENAFRYTAKEMIALLELKEGNFEKSKAIFRELASDNLVAVGIKNRAEEMLAIIGK